jgi:flagellar L-ring protein FlgH
MQPSNSSTASAAAVEIFVGSRCPGALAAALLCFIPAIVHAKPKPRESFDVSMPAAQSMPLRTAGAIFSGEGYQPLYAGARASRVGDVITIVLVERTAATKSNSASTGRNGEVGLTPPTTGPFGLFKPSDLNMGGDQSFKGNAEAAQSNTLSGEVSVTIAETYPNGTVLVRGEKHLTLNRGDEYIQVSGLVRLADVSADNRVASTRLANARIKYTGKGEIARASKQGWLQRFFSKVSPF